MTAPETTARQRRIVAALTDHPAAAVAAMAAGILDRMDRPVRIGVVGRAGTGKSSLLRLLARQPELAGCEITELTLAAADPADPWPEIIRDSDILLWCGQRFDQADLNFWSKVPEHLRDHSFLVVTQADRLAATGQLQPVLATLADLAGDQFHDLFAVATLQALQIATTAAADAPGAYRASGFAALKAALLHHIRQGRDAVQDAALVLIARHDKDEVTLPVTLPVPMPLPPVSADPEPDTGTPDAPWSRLHDFLDARARDLAPAARMPDQQKTLQVLDHCCDTTEGLVDLIRQDSVRPGCPAALTEEILTLSDTMLLLRHEGSPRSAADALALLLQVRRDFAAINST